MALGFFPSPYPDELLYSLCARYAYRVKYHSAGAINSELFGDATSAPIIDLPCRLNYLSASLPQGSSLSSDKLIAKHTLLRFYSPFLPPERLRRIRKGMVDSGAATIHELAGISASTINSPAWLRFCPRCVSKDRKELGECYWHRLHQVPGVLVCPDHYVFLENSNVRARRRTKAVEYVHAEHAMAPSITRSLTASNPDHQLLVKLAQDVTWLLTREDSPLELETIWQQFVELLTSLNLASRKGLVKRKLLILAVRESYPPALLDSLQCEFDEERSGNWVFLLLSHLKKGSVNHPVRYLLLTHLLGHTAESFFKICAEAASKGRRLSEPFGGGPWPCLNPACVNHRKPVVTTYRIKRARTSSHQIGGIFSCACGFSYLRRWGTASPDDRFSYHQTESYGSVWQARLRELWADPSVSLRGMVGLLGADRDAIKKQAATLGLSESRVGPRNRRTLIGMISRDMKKERSAKASKFVKERSARRKEFLAARRKHPSASRSQLQDIAARVYVWLYRYDKQWLDAHLPPLRVRPPGNRRPLYWEDRDAGLQKKVQIAASMLRKMEGRPVRVTAVAIIRYIDSHLQQSSTEPRLINSKWFLDRVPLTAKALNEVVEPILEYWRRKLDWASGHFRNEGRCPPRWQLMEYAGISRKGMTGILAALVEETLSSLRKATTIISYRAA